MRMLVILSLVAATAAVPAHAQVEGSRLTKYADQSDADAVLELWVGCIADLEGPWARRMLETVPTSEPEENVLSERHKGKQDGGWSDRCLDDDKIKMYGRQLAFSTASMRGELARYYLRTSFRNQGIGQRHPGGATAWLRDSLAALPAPPRYDRPVLVGHQFAACLADEHWAESRALVETRRGSKQEKAALAALSPKFGSCLTRGATMSLNVPILRLYLAEAVYHSLTHVPRKEPVK